MNRDAENGLVYVAQCLGDEIKIVCKSEHYSKLLMSAGYELFPIAHSEIYQIDIKEYYVKNVTDELMKANELSIVRDMGIPFSGGKEWNPQEVFEYLREKNLIKGGYLAIGWISPGHHVLEHR